MNATELRQAMAKLPEPKTDLKPPYWEYWRWELWQRVVRGDDPQDFWSWPCIYHTMLVDHWPEAIGYEAKRIEDAYPLDWDMLIQEKNRLLFHNNFHQRYHLLRWEQTTHKRIKYLSSIVEFGGGYGAMALVCRRLGFTGKYYIYDLSEFALLQQWFLSQNGVEGVEWNPKRMPKEIDLYMALYSISEVKPEERRIPAYAKSYLFLYSGQWEQYDNVKYFQQDITPLAKNWSHQELQHLPDKNNWYSIGW